MKHILILILSFLVYGGGAFWGSRAAAQSVLNIKGQKAMLDLGGQAWNPGDKIFALDGMGKSAGFLQIRAVKNGRAIAEITKGQAQAGMTLMLAGRGSPRAAEAATESRPRPRSRGSRSGQAYGFSAALMMNSMKIANFSDSNHVSHSFTMKGTNFGGGMFYDYPLTREWFVRGHGTLEMFSVSQKFATNICKQGTSNNCSADFIQAGGYGTFNFTFTPGPYRFWAGAGGGVLVYLSKTSTVLDTGKFFFNTVLMGAAGLDIFTSRTSFIPVAFEYQTIPDKEAGVTSLVIRSGWGTTF